MLPRTEERNELNMIKDLMDKENPYNFFHLCDDANRTKDSFTVESCCHLSVDIKNSQITTCLPTIYTVRNAIVVYARIELRQFFY